jgi:hypothetical protein
LIALVSDVMFGSRMGGRGVAGVGGRVPRFFLVEGEEKADQAGLPKDETTIFYFFLSIIQAKRVATKYALTLTPGSVRRSGVEESTWSEEYQSIHARRRRTRRARPKRYSLPPPTNAKTPCTRLPALHHLNIMRWYLVCNPTQP